MKLRMTLATSLITLLALFLLIAGCGDGGEEEATQTENVVPADEPAAAEAAEAATEAAADVVATHDCDGGCGMHGVPVDQMTEVEGKWYCAGCAKKVQAGGESQGDG